MKHVSMIAVALLMLTSTALAQTTTVVTVPYGEWLGMSRDLLLTGAGLAFAWFSRFLPGYAVLLIKTMQVDQILAKAIDYALNQVAGASRDKALSFDVGNAVVASAINYVTQHAGAWFMDFVGGHEMLKKKIQARVNLADNAKIGLSGNIEPVTGHDIQIAKAVKAP